MKFASFTLALLFVLTMIFSPALAMDNLLYDLVLGHYSGSYVDFLISNFGYALVVPAVPEMPVYQYHQANEDEIVCSISDKDNVLVAMDYCEQSGICWVLLCDPLTNERIGYARETDLEVLQFERQDISTIPVSTNGRYKSITCN